MFQKAKSIYLCKQYTISLYHTEFGITSNKKHCTNSNNFLTLAIFYVSVQNLNFLEFNCKSSRDFDLSCDRYLCYLHPLYSHLFCHNSVLASSDCDRIIGVQVRNCTTAIPHHESSGRPRRLGRRCRTCKNP